MSNNSSNINEAARRYAKALFLASENDNSVLSSFKNDFEKLNSAYNQSEDFRAFIMSPLIKRVQKKKTLMLILSKMKLSESFTGFFKIVAEHSKLFLLEKIYYEFKKLLDVSDGVTEVTVTTTEPIEKSFEKKIVESLSKKLNKKIRLNKLIKPELIGGIIIKIDSIMIDNSIKTKLLDYTLNERLN
ncbi:MAG: ATP synthase F1 subunit delta [Rickettsiales bacterium]|mgnify:FL=1|nr:ATP synthase F1 subunit delta [Rickettsiales bacterium]